MKKRVISLALSALMVTGLVGCGNSANADGTALKVGMVTDSGTIDDKSFNQGTWEGIKRAESDLGVEVNYLKPNGTTEADYTKEIGNLYDTGYKFIVTPGYKFETAVFNSQAKYEDAKFVIIDGAPHSGDYNYVLGKNTTAIYFSEEQSGFIAAVATALELKEGGVGFIGGSEMPPVQRFNWGFQQGIAYANSNLGTNITIKAENVVYQGSFDNSAAGQQLAAAMYDKGVKAIFAAAGGVGIGVVNEAKQRVANGEEAWVIGVDVDQYDDGLYEDGKSIVLTSAIKKIDEAIYAIIQDELNGEFKGGQTLRFDVTNDGVGIPEENPNLSEETITKVKEVYELMKSGEITVSTEKGDLIK